MKDLRPGYYIYGNKGAVWSKTCHIAKTGSFSGTTFMWNPYAG